MKKMKVITTCEAEGKLWQETEMEIKTNTDCMHVVNVYPNVKLQEVEGFGGAFTEASAHNYMGMSVDQKIAMLEAYFGVDGLRYNIGRVHMNSCDFGLGNYTYIEEGDEELKSFDVSHDDAEIFPLIQDAIQKVKENGEELGFLMSPWSPPAFMKTNNEMNHGGSLLAQYREAWANYFVKFIQEYRSRGIHIDSLTVQNEPEAVQTWDSCVYTAEEEGVFVGDYLGPALEAAGLSDVDIFVWDHNKEALFDRFSTTMSNPKAAKYIKGAAVHWYTGDHFEAIDLVRKEYPESKVIFTEGCVEYSRFADTRETYKAEMYAHDILGNLTAGISSYLDWNLFLDEKGGPNHVGNFCAAPIMCDSKNDTFEKRLTYYYIGHFSRYIQKGAVHIGTTRYTSDLETVAFLNPDNTRVLVVLNQTDAVKELTINENKQGINTTVPAHSITTYVF